MSRSLIFTLLLACDTTGTSAPPTSPTTAPLSSDPALKLDKLCGCALCKPLFSEDACKTDDDCAPAVPCHAKACVAKSKAELRKPDTMCTQDLHCDSADSNACGCVKGKCALFPRALP